MVPRDQAQFDQFIQFTDIVTFDSSAVVGTTEAAPSGSSAGMTAERWATEAAWYCHAAQETNTCSIQPWVWNPTRQAWAKVGLPVDVQGSEVVIVYCFGARTAMQFTANAGSYSRDIRFMHRGSVS